MTARYGFVYVPQDCGVVGLQQQPCKSKHHFDVGVNVSKHRQRCYLLTAGRTPVLWCSSVPCTQDLLCTCRKPFAHQDHKSLDDQTTGNRRQDWAESASFLWHGQGDGLPWAHTLWHYMTLTKACIELLSHQKDHHPSLHRKFPWHQMCRQQSEWRNINSWPEKREKEQIYYALSLLMSLVWSFNMVQHMMQVFKTQRLQEGRERLENLHTHLTYNML